MVVKDFLASVFLEFFVKNSHSMWCPGFGGSWVGQGFSSALEVSDDVGVEEKRGILPMPGKIPEGKNIINFLFVSCCS